MSTIFIVGLFVAPVIITSWELSARPKSVPPVIVSVCELDVPIVIVREDAAEFE